MAVFTEPDRDPESERLGAALRGALAALLLGSVAVALLGWNEARAAALASARGEIVNAAVEVSASAPGGETEGALLLVHGVAHGEQWLEDRDWGVRTQAIALQRLVRTYQWVERRERDSRDSRGGGGARNLYRYHQQWDARHHDSSRYRDPVGHANPPPVVASHSWWAHSVTLGALELGPGLVEQLAAGEALDADAQMLARLPRERRKRVRLLDGALRFRPVLSGGDFDPAAAQIGDHEIRHRRLADVEVTALAARRGHRLVPYRTPSGRIVAALRPGRLSAGQMAEALMSTRHMPRWLPWSARAAALLILWLGAALGLRAMSRRGAPVRRGSAAGAARLMASGALAWALWAVVVAAMWLRTWPPLALALALTAAAAGWLSQRLTRRGLPQ